MPSDRTNAAAVQKKKLYEKAIDTLDRQMGNIRVQIESELATLSSIASKLLPPHHISFFRLPLLPLLPLLSFLSFHSFPHSHPSLPSEMPTKYESPIYSQSVSPIQSPASKHLLGVCCLPSTSESFNFSP